MLKKTKKNELRLRRHQRVRNTVSGTPDCPRLNVFRSNANIYAQVIDDTTGKTLVSSSSLVLKLENGGNIEAAKAVGKDVAEKCLAANIESVCFDRGGYVYHGRVQALADAAREAGLKF
ncbi:50S ribosomal protein L18 [Galactobacillus timonensis]|jgi:large subunit ribosomal protein L18|uniref:50S ribosomal protein L18 n=1 Tax=Galactobacillus timonensis TaxID=2041840 RepID=UPI000C83ACF1|nr:50S ribosomal protein L18 [Galactobacillus timonensis]MDY6283055.1 50S ribosomal protein L18 [Erysipelotrichaceae bacterium]MCI6066633.1 50S ribosomal protein L18 [Galactobacillus timonensis]MCI6754111.1 50S ribosomal protein L18 [Galactobacillus timonensis]MDD5851033.1 50S ribosomal protein L18 [Galactobacillus timonensis]MDD6370506.1 50S ribosomal protein L18 [Galactobacillus timonensis]